MNSLNKVQLIGKLTANAEVKETPNGQKVATFSIATNRTWKDQDDKKQEQVEFHNVVAWAGLAGIVEQYTAKGKKVYVEGRLQTRSWEDEAGVKKYRTEIVAENIILLGDSQRGDGAPPIGDEFAPPKKGGSEEKPAKGTRAPRADEEIKIEDIPF